MKKQNDGIQNPFEQKENILFGLVGAFLFSLAGAVLWVILWEFDIIAGISGIVGVVCAIKGYSVFAKKESVKGVIFASIIAFAVIVLAWYGSLGLTVYQEVRDLYESHEIFYQLTYVESVKSLPIFFEDSDFAVSAITDLMFGLGFCIVGSVGYATRTAKSIRAQKAAANAPVAASPVVSAPTSVPAQVPESVEVAPEAQSSVGFEADQNTNDIPKED